MAWLLAHGMEVLLAISLLLNGVVAVLKLAGLKAASEAVQAVDDVVEQVTGEKKKV